MKKFIKSLSAIAIALVACYYYPLISFADFDVYNKNYLGYYNNLTNGKSFVNVTATNGGECNVSIVYCEYKNEFITANHGSGYINNENFHAEFDKYIIKKVDGTTVRVVNQDTFIVGSVEYTKNYIDINVNGTIFERSR